MKTSKVTGQFRHYLAVPVLFVAILFCASVRPVCAQTARADAAILYAQAAEAIQVDSPSNSNFTFSGYPPFGADWDRLAQDAWKKGVLERQLAHQAGLCRTAN